MDRYYKNSPGSYALPKAVVLIAADLHANGQNPFKSAIYRVYEFRLELYRANIITVIKYKYSKSNQKKKINK